MFPISTYLGTRIEEIIVVEATKPPPFGHVSMKQGRLPAELR